MLSRKPWLRRSRWSKGLREQARLSHLQRLYTTWSSRRSGKSSFAHLQTSRSINWPTKSTVQVLKSYVCVLVRESQWVQTWTTFRYMSRSSIWSTDHLRKCNNLFRSKKNRASLTRRTRNSSKTLKSKRKTKFWKTPTLSAQLAWLRLTDVSGTYVSAKFLSTKQLRRRSRRHLSQL